MGKYINIYKVLPSISSTLVQDTSYCSLALWLYSKQMLQEVIWGLAGFAS